MTILSRILSIWVNKLYLIYKNQMDSGFSLSRGTRNDVKSVSHSLDGIGIRSSGSEAACAGLKLNRYD